MTSGPGVPLSASACQVPSIVHSVRSGGLPLGVGDPPPAPPPPPPPAPDELSENVHVLAACPVVLPVSIGTSLLSGPTCGCARANDSEPPPTSISDCAI